MRILLWHVHGSWTDAFIRGAHDYLLPVLPERGPDGLGRGDTWDWPAAAMERTPAQLRDEDVDVVVLQRPHERELAERWLGRRMGTDLPAVYVEHNTPNGPAAATRHPMADRDDLMLVHVTHFNEVMWECGATPTTVISHGIVDPGQRYSGNLRRLGVAINEPVRRARVTGSDLLTRFVDLAPVDVFGMRVLGLGGQLGTDRLGLIEDLPRQRMHGEPGGSPICTCPGGPRSACR